MKICINIIIYFWKYYFFNDILEAVCYDKQNFYLSKYKIISKRLKRKMIKKINHSFKDLYNWCSRETKDKIKEIILKKLNIYDYFSLDEYLNYLYNMIIDIKIKNTYYILIIFFYLRKKIKQNNFMNDLKKIMKYI